MGGLLGETFLGCGDESGIVVTPIHHHKDLITSLHVGKPMIKFMETLSYGF